MMPWSSSVCPGRVGAPCNHRGKCDDGHLGNGTCACDTGFGGVACEQCSPEFYGATCRGELHLHSFSVSAALPPRSRAHSLLVDFQPVTAPNMGHVTAVAKGPEPVSAKRVGQASAARPRWVSQVSFVLSLQVVGGSCDLCVFVCFSGGPSVFPCLPPHGRLPGE